MGYMGAVLVTTSLCLQVLVQLGGVAWEVGYGCGKWCEDLFILSLGSNPQWCLGVSPGNAWGTRGCWGWSVDQHVRQAPSFPVAPWLWALPSSFICPLPYGQADWFGPGLVREGSFSFTSGL